MSHNTKSTDLSREAFELKSDQAFAKHFYRNFWIAVFIGFMLTIGGLYLTVIFGEDIDAWVSRILKAIFI